VVRQALGTEIESKLELPDDPVGLALELVDVVELDGGRHAVVRAKAHNLLNAEERCNGRLLSRDCRQTL
jgi:hypothetical protein